MPYKDREKAKQKMKEYRQKNKKKLSAMGKAWREKNKKHIAEYNEKNKEKIRKRKKAYMKEYTRRNKKDIKQKNTKYYKENRERISQQRKENRAKTLLKERAYNEKNAEAVKARRKAYRQRPEVRERRREWERKRRITNPQFRIISSCRGRVSEAIRTQKGMKRGKTFDLLAIPDWDFFIKHLTKKFKKGMTLKNYGKWHVDHIIPCASFDLTKESEQKRCFHYTNLQPLWAIENIRKGDRV